MKGIISLPSVSSRLTISMFIFEKRADHAVRWKVHNFPKLNIYDIYNWCTACIPFSYRSHTWFDSKTGCPQSCAFLLQYYINQKRLL